MVARLRAFFHDLHGATGVARGFGERSQKQFLADVVRARAGDQNAARIQQSQRPQIDLLVTTQRRLNGAAVFGEGRRIENDRVETLARVVVIAQLVEDVGRDEFDVCDVVEFGVAAGVFYGWFGDVDGGDALAASRNMERERTVKAETIKPATARVAHGRRAVLALIQKGAGLLSFKQVYPEPDPVLDDDKIAGVRRAGVVKRAVDHR